MEKPRGDDALGFVFLLARLRHRHGLSPSTCAAAEPAALCLLFIAPRHRFLLRR
jgi:hypothetical protein